MLTASLTSHRTHAPDALDARQIERAVAAGLSGRCVVEAVAQTGSTNDDLVMRARAHQSAHCILRAADFQTSGRGRQRRTWRAARGDALLFSIAIPLATAAGALPAVTLVCGVALAECFAAHGLAVQLKWPNDVRVDGCKLAGVLSEWVTDDAGRATLVIGIGVNWRLGDEACRAIGQPATALGALPAIDLSREQWIGRLAGAVLSAVQQFLREGFDSFQPRFNQMLEARGAWVDITDAGEKALTGRVIEVDRTGRLVIESGGGVRRAVSVGDVSVRAKQ